MSALHRQNNFDLIRLLAALQVVIAHAIGHTHLVNELPAWGKQLFDAFMMLPGVPIFFVISGFLISASFERNPHDLVGYFWRRGLRIFPALWVCLIVTIATLAIFGFITRDFVFSKTFFAWLAGQVSFFQFYNPEQFRDFGIGVANGALWTITVELQFYVFIPILYWLTGSRDQKEKFSGSILAVLFVLSFPIYCLMDHQVNGPGGFTGAPIAYKLLHMTLIPHLWMFILGISIHRNFEKLRDLITGKFIWWMGGYVVFMALLTWVVAERSALFYLAYLPSRILLAFATISAAFSARALSGKLLGQTDISYGIYIYHSIVINVLVQLGMLNSMLSVGAVYVISIVLALMSWHWVEKPSLACKSFSPLSIWHRLRGRAAPEN